MKIMNSVSRKMFSPGSEDFMKIAKVLDDYLDWPYSLSDVPEDIASKTLVEVYPQLCYYKVLRLVESYSNLIIETTITSENFLEEYLNRYEIVKNIHLNC